MKKVKLLLLALLPLFCNCQQDKILSLDSVNDLNITGSIGFQYAKIGEQKPNPYAISNILSAFSQLDSKTKGQFTEYDIQATHHYIAFTPGNEDEFKEVHSLDENEFVLSTYPMDYDVSDGLILPDSRFMKNGYSYIWAYVPINVELSSIQCPYILYYDIYFPYSTETDTKVDGGMPAELIDAIEAKSFEICGIDINSGQDIETKATKVQPYGRFRFWDIDSNTYRGVDGLSVRTVWGANSGYTHCDADGYFTSSRRYRNAFRYEIHFSRTDFIIRRNNATSEIVYKFSDYRGPIFKDFNDDEMDFFAVVSRAAIVYYYGDNCGLRRPPMRSDKSARLAIHAQLGSSNDTYGYYFNRENWVFADRPILHIYRQSNSSRRDNMGIYATTIHELAHASHWRNNESQFDSTDNQVIESFARGVQWSLAHNIDSTYTVPYYARQSYTGIVQDLIDGYGTKTSYLYGTWVNNSLSFTALYKSYYDHITGFTPAQIEAAVRKSKTWNELQYNIINDYPNVASANDIADAFTYWNSTY